MQNHLYNLQRFVSPLRCVFGCGGDRDRSKRNKMGKIAADFAEKLWITPDNPRFENLDKINSDIIKGIDSKNGKSRD